MNNGLSFWFGLLLVGLYFYIKYKIRKAREEKEHLEYIRSINLRSDEKKTFENSDNSNINIEWSTRIPDEYYEAQRIQEQVRKVHKKYESVYNSHIKLEDEINLKYSVAKELKTFDSPEMNEIIELCIKDISYAPLMIKYRQELKVAGENESWYAPLERYDTFKRLAIIYEKRKEYDKAIDICKQAINLRLIKDGSQGGYPGRMARLTRKNNNLNKKLKDGKEDIISDDVDYTIH